MDPFLLNDFVYIIQGDLLYLYIFLLKFNKIPVKKKKKKKAYNYFSVSGSHLIYVTLGLFVFIDGESKEEDAIIFMTPCLIFS